MRAVAIQTDAQGGLVSARSKGENGTSVFGAFGGDPFLAIIERMAAQMTEGEQKDTTSESEGETVLDGLLTPEENTGEESVMTMELAAMMFTKPPAVVQVSQTEIEMLANPVEEGTVQTDAVTTVQEAMPNLVETKKPVEETKKPADEVTLFPLKETQEGEGVKGETIKTTYTAQTKETTEPGEGIKLERRFTTAVEEAKKQMQEAKDSPTAAVPVDTGKAEPAVLDISLKKAEFTMESPKFAEQVKTEINTHLAKGDSEFTMKLKPEELGEITIKMLKTGGKVAVQIVAASNQTTQLLNNDLSALREALRPMQAEVRTVISVEMDNTQQQMQQFDMSHQQFAQQQNRSSHSRTSHGYQGENLLGEEILQEAENARLEDGSLSIYV